MGNKAEDVLGHRLNLRQWKWAYSLAICCGVPFPMMLCPSVMLMQLYLTWAPGLQLRKQQVPWPSDRTFACSSPQVSGQWKSSWWRDTCGHLTRFDGLRNSLETTKRSPSTLNTAWQRQCGNDSGFPTLPLLFCGCKNQILQCMIAITFAGYPAKRQEESAGFSGETECC